MVLKWRLFHPLFLLLFLILCAVLVTGAVEGSQSVKEAHRGPMRTVLAKSGTAAFEGVRVHMSARVWGRAVVCVRVSKS